MGIGISGYWYWWVLVLVGIGISGYWYWWVLVLVLVGIGISGYQYWWVLVLLGWQESFVVFLNFRRTFENVLQVSI